MYRTLDPEKIVATLDQLQRRIAERFPTAGLVKVCAELAAVAGESRDRTARLARPNLLVRAASVLVMVTGLVALAYIGKLIKVEGASTELFGMLQGIDALVNLLIVVGAVVLFLVTLEGRGKRRAALADLHELRSIVHVIDMHQLTKDPSAILRPDDTTTSSPKRITSGAELVRYLDYCSEMLSLSSKVAALYAQSTVDPLVIDTVNDIERLTTSLSQKIWQKINIIERDRDHHVSPILAPVPASATSVKAS